MQPFDHLAHDRVFGSFYLVVAQFGLGLQHQVYRHFCIASVLCSLLISFFFFLMKFSILFSCTSRLLLICVHFVTMPLQFFLPFFSVFCEMPFHIQFSQRFSFGLFPGCKQHFTWCWALAFLACFLSTFLLIFAVHLAAASSRSLTFSVILIIVFHILLPCDAPPFRQQSRCPSQ